MKNIFLITIFALLVAIGCETNIQNEPVDLNVVKVTVNKYADKYLNAWNTKDLQALSALVEEDGLFFGTDPSEVLDKNLLFDMWQKAFDDPNDYSLELGIRKIKIASDGKSAIVTEHLSAKNWSPKMQIRQIFQLVKSDKIWKIDFISWGFIVKNEDVDKINGAL